MSDRASQLRAAVAEFFEVDESRVDPSFPLNGPRGSSSIARASLDAAIRRRAGVRVSTVYTARTFGELAGEFLDGNGASAPARVAASGAPATDLDDFSGDTQGQGGISCGIDLETVASLPKSADHWDDTFYRTTFSPAEIAYCLAQSEPPQHFAARWCAKEALKKCDARFLNDDLCALEVALEASGKPYLTRRVGEQSTRLPHALSLSHTPDTAAAVVMRETRPATSPSPPASAPSSAVTPVFVPSPSRSKLSSVLALAALAVALFALYRTWPH